MSERCKRPAEYLRFWPGEEPDFVCKDHADDSEAIMKALGWDLRLEPAMEDHQCACSEGRVQRITVK